MADPTQIRAPDFGYALDAYGQGVQNRNRLAEMAYINDARERERQTRAAVTGYVNGQIAAGQPIDWDGAAQAAVSMGDVGTASKLIEMGRSGLPPGFQRTDGGALQPIPGGPADPGYLQKATDAKGTNKTDLIREFEYNEDLKRRGASGGTAPLPAAAADAPITRKSNQTGLEAYVAQKRGGAGEYGLQPVYGTGPDGKPVVLQLGKSGEAIAAKVPDGVTISTGVDKIDQGTHWAIIDKRSGQVVGVQPKNVAEAAAQREYGTKQGEVQFNLPSALESTRTALKTIDQIRRHPGREWGTGAFAVLPGIPNTSQKGFIALVDQLKGKSFLEAFNSLKGGGAITEMEGQKATDAIARLDRAQNKEDFDTALSDLEGVLKNGMMVARQKASTPAPGIVGQPNAAAAAPQPSAPQRARNPQTGQTLELRDGRWVPAQ